MDDMTAFERQVADEIFRIVGPARPIQGRAVREAAANTPRVWVQSLFSATRFAVAAVVLTLVGGFLLVAQPFDQHGATAPGAASDAALEPSEGDGCPSYWLDQSDPTDLVAGCSYGLSDGFVGIRVPTSGWAYFPPFGGDRWSIEKGDAKALEAGTRPDASITFWLSTPDGIYADPCSGVRSEPLYVPTDHGQAILQHSTDLVAAMAAIPGIEVLEDPSEADLPDGGHAPATAIRVPEDACTPFHLWWDSDFGPRRIVEPGTTIRIWSYNHPYWSHPRDDDPIYSTPARVWIEAELPADADPQLEDEIQQIIDSIGTPR